MAGLRRVVIVTVILLVITALLPGLVLAGLGLSAETGVATLGIMSGLLAALLGGRRVGFLLAVPFAAAAALAVATAESPWLAALLMLVVAGARAWLSVRGLHVALTSAVIAVGFLVSDPTPAVTYLPAPVMTGLVTLVAALYGAGVVALFGRRRPHTEPSAHLSPKRAQVFAVASGATVAVATWFVVRFDVGHTGAWVIITIVVVLQPYVQDGIRKALERSAGTVLGFAAAFAIGLVTSSPVVFYALGMAALGWAIVLITMKRPYWAFAGALTAAIVLLEGASTSVTDTALHRLAATAVGVALSLAVTALEQPWAKRVARRHGATHY